ncbi:hypothetical protein EVAR_59824_1 [Eumeta japonica]|uniref:Uncharacterized protein n=1 Tax=Eumeta variegata TaxID=151549 RepID=A0A4C1ZBG7_EUMVA|nr:hypothetical protein EVAR_59824_1 [Eumeta japonica]
MTKWKGRVPLTRSHCERITNNDKQLSELAKIVKYHGVPNPPTARRLEYCCGAKSPSISSGRQFDGLTTLHRYGPA